MCLQWCHVRSQLIDNDLSCALWCADDIRLAHAAETCDTCRHYHAGVCALTRERVPLARTCCHHNAEPQRGMVILRLGENVPLELARAHGAASVRQIFDRVDSAPDMSGAPEDGIEWRIEEMSVPLVYGVRASCCWDTALTGRKSIWCDEYPDPS